MKLGLGTVQFGLDYGISNREGRVARAEAARIVDRALEGGIELIDTAHLYGESETVLGEIVPPGARVKIVTKTPRFAVPTLLAEHADRLEESVRESCRRLRRATLYAVLLHHAQDALAPGSELLFERLTRLKQAGLVRKIGVSVYSPDELERVLARHSIDIVQLPFNVLDQRLPRRAALVAELFRRGVEVHVRSIFLQGLLLMSPATLDRYFDPWQATLIRVRQVADAAGLSPLELALGAVLAAPFVQGAVVGVCSAAQLDELMAAARAVEGRALPDLSSLAVDDQALVDPSRWPPRGR